MFKRCDRLAKALATRCQSLEAKWTSAAGLFSASILALALICGGAIGPSMAQGDDPAFSAPVYNKDNGSYYELVHFPAEDHNTWATAERLAESRVYHGRRGRLGVIKDEATHLFIAKHFGVKIKQNMWIGLTYQCASHELVWVDGSVYKPGDFSDWASSWIRQGYTPCVDTRQYMPVYYTAFDQGFFWQAVSPAKAWSWFLVEYPAPNSAKKANDASAKKTASDSDSAKTE